MPVIKVEHLTRDYGNGQGIFDVSFELHKGEVFGFLGPNGAGKTTTIRHLMGFLKPEQGLCSINGLDCWKDRDRIQRDLGYLPGEISFFDDMTAESYLNFLIQYKKLGKEHRKDELVKRFDLNTSVKIKKMSKGTKQKVGIVAAFMHDPNILILDEPTSGLDPLMQNHFIELILEEKERGKTILMSSHIFEEVERTCENIGIIRQGKLIAIDSVEALRAAQIQRYMVTFKHSEDMACFLKEMPLSKPLFGLCVEVTIQNNLNTFLQILSHYDIVRLTSPGLSLENIFMKYYGGNEHD